MKKTIRLADQADINVIFDIRTSVQENHLSRDQLAGMGMNRSSKSGHPLRFTPPFPPWLSVIDNRYSCGVWCGCSTSNTS